MYYFYLKCFCSSLMTAFGMIWKRILQLASPGQNNFYLILANVTKT